MLFKELLGDFADEVLAGIIVNTDRCSFSFTNLVKASNYFLEGISNTEECLNKSRKVIDGK